MRFTASRSATLGQGLTSRLAEIMAPDGGSAVDVPVVSSQGEDR